MGIDESELSKKDLKQLLNKKLENLKELEKLGKNSNYIQELSDVSLIQLKLENYIDSEKNYLLCLKHFKKQKDRLGQAAVYGLLGTLNYKRGEFLKSIESYTQAHDIYKDLKQASEQVMCLKGIGNSLIKLNKLEEACDIFLDCSAICSDNNDIYNLLDCLSNLILIHERKQEWDVVFELYKKTLEAFKQLKDEQGMIMSYFNLGILKKKNNKLSKALKYFKKGTNLAIEANYYEIIIKGLSYVGEILFYLGRIKEAKNQFIKGLYFAKKIDAKNAIIQLKVLLNSLGLSDSQIIEELREYERTRKI